MPAGFRGGFATLVGVTEERVLDIEVPLVRRDLHRLAHATAGKMQRRCHVGELDEVDEVIESAVAPAALDVADEWRPADRREHRGVAAEAHVALGVAREQRELLRGGGEQLARQAARYVYALFVHVRTGIPPQA